MEQAVISDERRWIWGYALVLAALTSIPYLVGALVPHPGWAFSGFVFGVDDGNSYLAKLRAGAMGAWLFKTPYTTFPQQGAPVFLPFLLLGKLATFNPTHTTLAIIFQLFRLAALPAAVLATYRFVALFVPEIAWRRWVTVLATAGEGLGWLFLALWPAALASGLPLSFISPETFGFLAFYGLPHLILARALLLLALTSYVEARGGLRSFWRVGIWLLGLVVVQPIGLVPAATVMVGIGLAAVAAGGAREGRASIFVRETLSIAKSWLPALPLIVPLALSYAFDPYLTIWGAQNRIEAPPLVYYAVAYAAVILPAAFGAWRTLRSRLSESRVLPLIWVVCLPALIYAPLTVQRRLAEGSWVAWLILAAVGLGALPKRWHRPMRVGLLAISVPASVILLVGGLRIGYSPSPPAFLPIDKASALSDLSKVAPRGSVLLAAIPVANAAPAWAGVKVPVGHGPESANYDEERARVEAFYGGRMDVRVQEAYLAGHGIGYIFYGPDERQLGSWQPSELPGLRLAVSEGDCQIYAVGQVLAERGRPQ
jgi:hypothetical protein